MQYKDEPAYVGWNGRFALTRKAIEQHKFFTEAWESPTPDWRIWKYAKRHNLYRKIGRWYGKKKVKDDTYREGICGGWELKDKNILNNLVYKEIDIYG